MIPILGCLVLHGTQTKGKQAKMDFQKKGVDDQHWIPVICVLPVYLGT
jgi:hypothetical protein